MAIDSRIYSEQVLYKCFYWFSQDYTVDISIGEGSFYNVLIQPNKENTVVDWDTLAEKVKQQLIDFKLRDIVSNETKTIRELIVAKAFACYDIDTTPQTNVSDPVGFIPAII
ncbi:hypothetical protein GCM10022209_47950 [Chitinophaga oryziterrae]